MYRAAGMRYGNRFHASGAPFNFQDHLPHVDLGHHKSPGLLRQFPDPVLGKRPDGYGRMNKRPRGLDEMLSYQQKSVVKNGADPRDVGIELDSPIIVGKFLDLRCPTYEESRQRILDSAKEKGRL